jgi:type I restriction enzyme R subunit
VLLNLNTLNPEDRDKRQKEIIDSMAGNAQLRSKRVLIEAFIAENLTASNSSDDVMERFAEFWTEHQQKAFEQLCTDENIVPEQLQKLLNNYTFANDLPKNQEIKSALNFKPKILESKTIVERIKDKIQAFIDTFIEGMGGSI